LLNDQINMTNDKPLFEYWSLVFGH